MLELPINIITENKGFTMLVFLLTYAQTEYSVSMCAEIFLIHEFK